MSLDPSDQRKSKDPNDFDLTKDFSTFINQGSRKKSKKSLKFATPPSPNIGLDKAFGSDEIGMSNKIVSTKLTKRFFDFWNLLAQKFHWEKVKENSFT